MRIEVILTLEVGPESCADAISYFIETYGAVPEDEAGSGIPEQAVEAVIVDILQHTLSASQHLAGQWTLILSASAADAE